MSTDNNSNEHLPARVGDPLAEAMERAAKYHPVWGLQKRLLIDGRLFVYDEYLDAWTGPQGVTLGGHTILTGMSYNTRVEVAQ